MRRRLHLALPLLAVSTLIAIAARAQAPAAAPPAAAPPPPASADANQGAAKHEDWVKEYDALYDDRDQPKNFKAMYKLVEDELAKNPNSYEGWWRKAQLDCWQANGMKDGTELKKDIGKSCWDAGEKAVSINPDDVKGQYWATVGMGLYSEGLGILSALSQGIEGKFKNRVQTAIKLDKNYLDGGPTMLFARFYWKLPWPKRDLNESNRLLQETIAAHPHNLRAKLFYADTVESQGNHELAVKTIQEILDAPLGWDKADDRRNKAQAKDWLDNHK